MHRRHRRHHRHRRSRRAVEPRSSTGGYGQPRTGLEFVDQALHKRVAPQRPPSATPRRVQACRRGRSPCQPAQLARKALSTRSGRGCGRWAGTRKQRRVRTPLSVDGHVDAKPFAGRCVTIGARGASPSAPRNALVGHGRRHGSASDRERSPRSRRFSTQSTSAPGEPGRLARAEDVQPCLGAIRLIGVRLWRPAASSSDGSRARRARGFASWGERGRASLRPRARECARQRGPQGAARDVDHRQLCARRDLTMSSSSTCRRLKLL